MEIKDLFSIIHPLSSQQREDVMNKAVQTVQALIQRPSREQFENSYVSEYPAWLKRWVLIALVGLLVASATPSFFRLVHAGATYFKHGIDDNVQAVLVGFSIFFMSELMLILIGISRQVLFKDKPLSKHITTFIMFLAFSLSIVGNWTVAKPDTLFGWLETITPPFATIAIALILEGLILETVKARHVNEVAYQQALSEYHKQMDTPQAHPRWNAVYFGLLKDAIQQANRQGRGASERVAVMSELEQVHWQYLISREHFLSQQSYQLIDLQGVEVVGMALEARSRAVHDVHEQRERSGRSRMNSVNAVNTMNSMNPSPERQKVIQFFEQNPNTTMSYREIAQQLGVSIGLISQVKKEMRGEK